MAELAANPKTTRRRPAKRDHYAEAMKWSAGVEAGTANVGKLLRAAVLRHVADLERAKDPAWPYRFDPEAGRKACRFAEHLRHIKGPKAGERLHLDPWQCWLICVGFGWVRKDTGLRRWRRFTWFMPRGQGKTILGSIVCLSILREGKGAEVVTAATTREQARLASDVASLMLKKAADLRDHYGFEVGAHAITQPATGSVMKPVSAEAGAQEGGNYAAVLCDEIHAHPTRALYDTLLTGCGKRPDSLFVCISTAGTNTGTIGWEVYQYARRVLEGHQDDAEFAVIIEADRERDPWDPSTWEQANPGLGISVDRTYIEQVAAKARAVPSAAPAFYTRHLGWWVGSSESAINMQHWDACTDETFDRTTMTDTPCWVGLDLATKTDITAVAFVWRREVDGANHYWIAVDSYLPEAAIEASGNASYAGWVATGFIKTNEGNQIDFRYVTDEIVKARDVYGVREVAFDNLQPAVSVAQELNANGIDTVEVRGAYVHMNRPMRELEGALASGHVHLEPNPCLRWMASNVIAKTRGDEIRPEKEGNANKIDGMSAIYMALNRVLADDMPYSSGEGLKEL